MGENVRSVDRILDLMEVLAEERAPISLSELADGTELSKTTVHRLMQTLCNREYAEKIGSEGYILGPKIIELACYYIENLELHTVARPWLKPRATNSRISEMPVMISGLIIGTEFSSVTIR